MRGFGTMAEAKVLDETRKSLVRIQEFSASSLIQSERLGAIAFNGAVNPASRIISHFKLLPYGALDQFPESELGQIKSLCDSVFSVFSEILNFDTEAGENKSRQANLISRLDSLYQSVFSQSYAFIAYSTARTVDFNKLDEQGRAAVQGIKDQSDQIVQDLSEKKSAIERILEDTRNAAAEQGVTLQAKFFGDESIKHGASSIVWLRASMAMVLVVVLYSVATLFFSQIPSLTAKDTATSIQITSSKFLVFFVLVYALFQCVKNYSAHMHNSVVNKHRQNSLLTYRTLSEASGTQEGREIILQHASAAIYAPNDSGYVRNEERGYIDGGMMNLVSRTLNGSSGGSQP